MSPSSAVCVVWHVVGADLVRRRLQPDHGPGVRGRRLRGQLVTATSVPSEAPFDWYQLVLKHLATVSTAGVWLRLPALLAGIGTWILLSRCADTPDGAPGWPSTASPCGPRAVVFLAAWFPFTTVCGPNR